MVDALVSGASVGHFGVVDHDYAGVFGIFIREEAAECDSVVTFEIASLERRELEALAVFVESRTLVFSGYLAGACLAGDLDTTW